MSLWLSNSVRVTLTTGCPWAIQLPSASPQLFRETQGQWCWPCPLTMCLLIGFPSELLVKPWPRLPVRTLLSWASALSLGLCHLDTESTSQWLDLTELLRKTASGLNHLYLRVQNQPFGACSIGSCGGGEHGAGSGYPPCLAMVLHFHGVFTFLEGSPLYVSTWSSPRPKPPTGIKSCT